MLPKIDEWIKHENNTDVVAKVMSVSYLNNTVELAWWNVATKEPFPIWNRSGPVIETFSGEKFEKGWKRASSLDRLLED